MSSTDAASCSHRYGVRTTASASGARWAWARCPTTYPWRWKYYLNCTKTLIMSTSWFHIDNIDELDTPALVVYPDRVKENIRRAIAMVGKAERLRPHVKTHKSPAVTRL